MKPHEYLDFLNFLVLVFTVLPWILIPLCIFFGMAWAMSPPRPAKPAKPAKTPEPREGDE
jgi:hypothetical protein